ncbi:response regulator [Myxococcus qinghaiensis]|uniref:response regulator n=1 Tax=Myxococcus qinghaiensis TaxID=2906758 RepID=UPI0020A825B6|nr:response regulator [Myxococcus qinghaiensis]MCP3162692.1 response regulator [Myxococcus qinghaiensis]
MPLILLVDDDSTLLEIYTEALEQLGCDVASAPDGEMALSLALSLKPDLILTDVMMPGMSGLELCRRLRADERLCRIPRIVHSSMECRPSAPGEVFLRKSGELSELLRCVAQGLAHGDPPSAELSSAA